MEYSPSFRDSLYLAHHGIKGMHWGIRRYQNPDGSLTSAGKVRRSSDKSNYAKRIAIGAGITAGVLAVSGGIYLHNINHNTYGLDEITTAPLKDRLDDFGTDKSDITFPKGTKFQRISKEATEDYISRGHTYVSKTLHDNLVYRNKMPSVLGTDRPYIHTLKTESTVKAPSRRKAAEIYLQMRPSATQAEYKKFMRTGIRENNNHTKEFLSRLFKEGYNAVIDENDAGGKGIAHKPMILFNPNVSTKHVHRMNVIEKVLATI